MVGQGYCVYINLIETWRIYGIHQILSVNAQSKEPNTSLLSSDMYATSHDWLHTSFQNLKGCVEQLDQDVHHQHPHMQTSSHTRVEQYATKSVFLLATYYRTKLTVTCLLQSTWASMRKHGAKMPQHVIIVVSSTKNCH